MKDEAEPVYTQQEALRLASNILRTLATRTDSGTAQASLFYAARKLDKYNETEAEDGH